MDSVRFPITGISIPVRFPSQICQGVVGYWLRSQSSVSLGWGCRICQDRVQEKRNKFRVLESAGRPYIVISPCDFEGDGLIVGI